MNTTSSKEKHKLIKGILKAFVLIILNISTIHSQTNDSIFSNDVLGRVIHGQKHSGSKTIVNISPLPSGVYFIKLVEPNLSYKIIKL